MTDYKPGQLAQEMEVKRLCALGQHAWVPWLAVLWAREPDEEIRVHHYETWCCRAGCDHHEQWDP